MNETTGIKLVSKIISVGLVFTTIATLILSEHKAKEIEDEKNIEQLKTAIRNLAKQQTAEIGGRLTCLFDDLNFKVNSKLYPGPDISEIPTSSSKVDTKRQEPEQNENVLYKIEYKTINIEKLFKICN